MSESMQPRTTTRKADIQACLAELFPVVDALRSTVGGYLTERNIRPATFAEGRRIDELTITELVKLAVFITKTTD